MANCGTCLERTSLFFKDVGVLQRVQAQKFLEEAKKEKQEGIQFPWQQESPAKEVLDQVRRCADTDCTPKMMGFG